jgi:hypothetical protein
VNVEIHPVVRDDSGESLGDASQFYETVVGAVLQIKPFDGGGLGTLEGPRAVPAASIGA